MSRENPFQRMVDTLGDGNIKNLMIKLYPLSYTGVYSYIRGDQSKISNRVKEILSNHYTDVEIAQIEQDYVQWRANRSINGQA